MIAVVETEAGRCLVLGAMRERESGAALTERRDDAVMGDPAKRDDGGEAWHRRDGGGKELPAGGDLGRQRLVFGGDAAHGIADRGIDQREPVVGACRVSAGGKAEGD